MPCSPVTRPRPQIFGDWGSTRLRLWLMEDGVAVRASEAPGLLMQSESPAALLHRTLNDLGVETGRVLLCGMAGARSGLSETPYLPCPADRGQLAQATRKLSFGDFDVQIVPGLSCADGRGNADVLRGEETQVLGAACEIGGNAVMILPGTHTKWVEWRDGKIQHFATAMTGEMLALLHRSSLLDEPLCDPDRLDAEGFADGLTRSLDDEPLTTQIFAARAMRMTGARTLSWAHGFLSGLLIGHEVRLMRNRAWTMHAQLVLIADGILARCYSEALSRFGAEVRVLEPKQSVLAGLEQLDAATR